MIVFRLPGIRATDYVSAKQRKSSYTVKIAFYFSRALAVKLS